MLTRALKSLTGLFVLLGIVLSACAVNATATPFVAPTRPNTAAPVNSPTPPPVTFAPQPTAAFVTQTPSALQTITPITPTQSGPCNDSLLFVQDITIADGTIFAPGASIDKRWLVANVGTCNWDTRYRLRLTNGVDLGAAAEQALYPARANTQAVIRIVFTAPQTPGIYRSEWQAYSPDGTPFGTLIYTQIVVQTP